MASQNRLLNFFASAKGRRFSFYAATSTALGAFLVNFVPDTFAVKKYREIVATYREGVERSVSETLQKRFDIAMEYLKVTDFEKRFLQPFMVSGFESYNIGSLKFKYGALVGIPINYTYTAPNEIDRADIIIRGKSVDWNSKGGKLFEESLILTEEEQIFGITREMIQLQYNKVLLNSIYPTATVFMMYSLASGLNSKLRLFYRPLSLRICLYAIVGFFGFGVYSLFSDFTQVSYDGKTDEVLASLGPGFVSSGVRFYEKLLKKNVACRELTGDNSEYTAFGNENYLVRRKRLPLTIRKAFFELKLEELNKQSEASAESNAQV